MAHAIITGGSSGIGLALAIRLARDGHALSLIARDAGRLARAREAIAAAVPAAPDILTLSCDVGDAGASLGAIAQAIGRHGAPLWAIACAGIVRPGRFRDLPLEAHDEQMRTNYFGAVNVVKAVYPAMAAQGTGRIVLVASGAAMLGIYGYAAYGPSKFALRGLAETLRVECADDGISVSIAYPPDTDTPQLAAERAERPAETARIAEGGGLWQPDAVARAILDRAARGQFAITPGWQMGLLYRLHSLIGPAFRVYQRRAVAAVRREKDR